MTLPDCSLSFYLKRFRLANFFIIAPGERLPWYDACLDVSLIYFTSCFVCWSVPKHTLQGYESLPGIISTAMLVFFFTDGDGPEYHEPGLRQPCSERESFGRVFTEIQCSYYR